MLLKLPVGAILSTVACVLITFSRHHPIQAPLPTVIGDVVVLYARIFIILGPAEARLHFVILGYFPLAVQVDIFFYVVEVFQTVPEVVQPNLVVLEHADQLHNKKRGKGIMELP